MTQAKTFLRQKFFHILFRSFCMGCSQRGLKDTNHDPSGLLYLGITHATMSSPVPSFITLKVLSSEMDQAESRLIR
jgi:hypothetical protein